MSKPGFINVGDINNRLAHFKVTAAFITDTLGVPSDEQNKRSHMWREAKWPTICKNFSMYVRDCAENTSKAVKSAPPADDDEL